LVATTGFTVRAPETADEIDQYFRLAFSTFAPKAPPEQYTGWRDAVVNAPEFDRGQLRFALAGERVVGGLIIYDRAWRWDPACLRTACIGGVATHPDFRHQGIASAVLRDATRYATAEGYALLLLDGIPNFYGQFGYVDVFDYTWHGVEVKKVCDLPAVHCTARLATMEDASALLALYERHYGNHPGGFVRTLEKQRYNLGGAIAAKALTVAVGPEGNVCGYYAFTWEYNGARAAEVSADDWDAALALLHFHAGLLQGQPEPPAELIWPLPEGSQMHAALADRLPLQTRRNSLPNGGWLARPANLAELWRSLLPLWQARWALMVAPWTGRLGLHVAGEDASCVLDLAQGHIARVEGATPDAWVTLTSGALTQFVCGFRPAEWLARQPGVDVLAPCLPALAALFPAEGVWIPGTDAF
jgi:predicted N-acetyltransferase YhbS